MTDICERWRASADALWHRDETAARRAAVEVALGVAHLADASLREILADVVGGADDVRIAARRLAAEAVFAHAADPAAAAAWRAAAAAASGALAAAGLHAAAAAAWVVVDVDDADDADDDSAAWVAARDRALERTIARIARIAPTVAVRAVVGR